MKTSVTTKTENVMDVPPANAPIQHHKTHHSFTTNILRSFQIYVGLLFWHFLFFWQFPLYLLSYYAYAQGYGWIILLLLTWYCTVVALETEYWRPYKKRDTIEGKSDGFVQSSFVQEACHWFPIQIIKTADLPPNKQYIVSLHPHGLMPWGLLPVGRSAEWNSLFPNLEFRCVAASVLFKIPIAREASIWAGGCPAGRHDVSKVLEKGYNLGVLPGGSEELMEQTPGQELIFIKNRKGFVRLALIYGCDLVPGYIFGVNDLYTQMTWGKQFRMWLLRKTRIAFTFGWGRSFYNLLPERKPIFVVVGKPIQVSQVPCPTDEQIDELHKRYVDEVVNIFETYKSRFGYKNRKLIIK